jgi:hypothetical protein
MARRLGETQTTLDAIDRRLDDVRRTLTRIRQMLAELETTARPAGSPAASPIVAAKLDRILEALGAFEWVLREQFGDQLLAGDGLTSYAAGDVQPHGAHMGEAGGRRRTAKDAKDAKDAERTED